RNRGDPDSEKSIWRYFSQKTAMTLLFYLLPFLLSSVIGFLAIGLIFKNEKSLALDLHCFLGAGLGMAVSAYITFTSFLLLNHLNRAFVIVSHLAVLAVLIILFIKKVKISGP